MPFWLLMVRSFDILIIGKIYTKFFQCLGFQNLPSLSYSPSSKYQPPGLENVYSESTMISSNSTSDVIWS